MLTYELVFSRVTGKYKLESDPEQHISWTAWEEFGEFLEETPGVRYFPPEVIQKRWETKNAAIAVHKGEIISYSSLVPAYSNDIRTLLAKELNVGYKDMPDLIIYEPATGATKPNWTNQGINKFLLTEVTGYHKTPKTTFMMFCIGLAASHLVEHLGWTLSGWSEYPFATSLVGWEEPGGMFNKTRHGRVHLDEIKPYEGGHIANANFDKHEWEKFYHIWCEDMEIVREFNRDISQIVDGKLERWHRAVEKIKS